MSNRTLLAPRLCTGISREHLDCLVEGLAAPDSRANAMLQEEESGSGLRVPAPAISWRSSTGWWLR
jgi:hypothetical protein